MNEIQKLIKELNEASDLYYNGKESFLTDKEFDIKIDELKKLEQKNRIIYSNSPTINVGAPILNSLNKIQIKNKPMLSLNKVHLDKEILSFFGINEVVASVKCDGLSVRLIYKDTDLISANTRGNGFEGGDITEHIKHFLNVPLKIAKTGTYIVDGEAIIFDSDFQTINKNNEFKNNRNTASGSLALLDMSIVKKRRLSFICWDVIEGGNSEFYFNNLNDAKHLGFTIVPKVLTNKIKEQDINRINLQLLNEAEELGIPCDGIVWRFNDNVLGQQKGQTAHHFLNAVAWKPQNEEYETELLDIEWSMSRTGTLTPVAIFKPIDIDGSTVSRANLSNVSIMRETLGKCPELRQKIWVSKRNQIIPKIERAIKNDIPHDHILPNGIVPTYCPICGEEVRIFNENETEVAKCINSKCEGKLVNIITHYCDRSKGVDIRGLSEKTIEQLIEWGWLNGIKDLYTLKEHRIEWQSKKGFGETSVNKILDAIDTSSRSAQLDSFISAIGIPLVGRTVAKEITKYYLTWEDFKDAIGGDWTQFYGFGYEMSKAINNFNYAEADYIAEHYLTFIQPDDSSKDQKATAAGLNFVITGKLSKKRDDIKADIEKCGGKVTGSVSSKTNYLVCNDKNSTTGKSADAKKLNIPVISEEELNKLLGI